MKHLYLIGMGPGGPEYLTVQAIETLKQVDVFFMLEKDGRGKERLLQLRRDILERYLGPEGYRVVVAESPRREPQPEGYAETVRRWHAQKRELFIRLIDEELGPDERGAFLLWGDPALYDQTLTLIGEVMGHCRTPFDYSLIPGITSVQLLCARHRIPLNRVGEPITITTARHIEHGDPAAIHNAVVMLDGQAAHQRLKGQDLDLYWGGNLGCPDEIIAAGPLDELSDQVRDLKAEARAHGGWMMDVYLLRRRTPPEVPEHGD